MTPYSPLRSASSEFGKLSVALTAESETLPIELVLGMPTHEKTIYKSKANIVKQLIGMLCQ